MGTMWGLIMVVEWAVMCVMIDMKSDKRRIRLINSALVIFNERRKKSANAKKYVNKRRSNIPVVLVDGWVVKMDER